MAIYDALIAKWGTLTPGTTQAKLTQLNAIQITLSAVPAILAPSQILNAIVFADLASLTQLQVSQLTLLVAGTAVDASAGSTIRLGIQALFAGKATTLANLAALIAPFDAPKVPWWQATVAQGGGGLSCPVTINELAGAGGLT